MSTLFAELIERRRCQVRMRLFVSVVMSMLSQVLIRPAFATAWLRRGRLRSLAWLIPALGLPGRSSRERAKSGGARRDRTDDLMLAKHALSQLSYGPLPEDECLLVQRSPPLALRRSSLRSRKACRAEAAWQRRLVGLGRLELPTSRLSSARSNQLSYKPQRSP